MKHNAFISYSHADAKIVKQFALQLSLRGFDLWMDEKDLSYGKNYNGNYTTAIFRGIHESDLYLLFVSKNSVQSRWVGAEIDFALHEKIERDKPIIIPVRLDDTELPVALSNPDCIDARFSIFDAANELAKKFAGTGTERSNAAFDLASVSVEISENTAVEVGPFNGEVGICDLEKDREQVLKKLRKTAHGILLNFIPAEDFDFQSPLPKYKNGMYEESSQRVSGSTSGSICEKAKVEAVVFHPDWDKVMKLLDERLEILNINAITFGFTVPTGESESLLDVGTRCLQKLQETYIILSCDNIEGATVEIGDDFYLSSLPAENVLKIRLSTKYPFQFEKRMKEFSLIDFLRDTLGIAC